MDNDSIQSSGENTLVTIWVEGKLRAITISREAIETFLQLPPERAMSMTDEDRREFVRTHLRLVTAAARTQLLSVDPSADTVMIDDGHPRWAGRRTDGRAPPERGSPQGRPAQGRPTGRDRPPPDLIGSPLPQTVARRTHPQQFCVNLRLPACILPRLRHYR